VKLAVKLTLESGISCCPFGDMHREAERLLGHPIWTHEFGMTETWEDILIALAAEDEGAFYHPRRLLGPIDTLRLMAPDKPIIAIDADTRAVWRADRDKRPRVGP